MLLFATLALLLSNSTSFLHSLHFSFHFFVLLLLLLSFFGPFNHSRIHSPLTFCSISVCTSNTTPFCWTVFSEHTQKRGREKDIGNEHIVIKRTQKREREKTQNHLVCSSNSFVSISMDCFRRFYLFNFSLYLFFSVFFAYFFSLIDCSFVGDAFFHHWKGEAESVSERVCVYKRDRKYEKI